MSNLLIVVPSEYVEFIRGKNMLKIRASIPIDWTWGTWFGYRHSEELPSLDKFLKQNVVGHCYDEKHRIIRGIKLQVTTDKEIERKKI